MCYPKHDRLILELLEAGKIIVNPAGRGFVYVRYDGYDGQSGKQHGHYYPVAEHVQQAGGRPSAGEYRSFLVNWHGRQYRLRVHRVVWVAVHGATPLEIDHVNDDPLHCGIGNLHPLTRQENQAKALEAKWYREQHPEWFEDSESGTTCSARGSVHGDDLPF